VGEHLWSVLLALEERVRLDELAHALRDASVGVERAAVADALARIDAAPVDVLVADVRSCVGPASLASEARRRAPEIEVVAVAGSKALALVLEALRAGASDVVATPLDTGALAAAVTRAVERRRVRGLAARILDLARNAALGQLTGGIAHEVTNPVAALLSGSSAIAEGVEQLAALDSISTADDAGEALRSWWKRAGRAALEHVREASGDVTAGAERLKTLARDVRGIARADPAVVTLYEVGDAIHAALRMARAELVSQAQVVLDDPAGICAVANRDALAHALVHLLVRAPAAAQAAGRRRANVRLRARRDGATTVIEVEDDVPPAPRDEAWRLLAPHLPAGMPPGPGALGLAVARDLVERQGGTLEAHPRAGGGTIFELRLPAPEPESRRRSS